MKRGVYFTLDGVFAALIIISATVLYLSLTPIKQPTDQLQTTASDAVTILNTLTVAELPPALAAQVLATNQTNENDTVLRAITVLWAINDSLAPVVTQKVFETFFPKYSYAVYAESTLLFNSTKKPQNTSTIVANAKQQVSGIAAGLPVVGNTATAFLQKVENKSTASFAYFGGFVGQGNLTVTLPDLPADIAAAMVRDVTLELDTPAAFTLYINGIDCGYYVPQNPANMVPDSWAVTGCDAAFVPDDNTVTIGFNASVDNSYVSGGFLRVRYRTNLNIEDPYATPHVMPLPGITGIVNLYDSFFVPGAVTSMEVYLHYLANITGPNENNTFYFSIGDTVVFSDNYSATSQTLTLTDVNLSSILNYSALSSRTVPIRVGFENFTFSATYEGNADVVLITDVSGSMNWRMDQNSVNGVVRACTDPLINASDTQRLSVAKCLDKEFVFEILNVTNNLLGLVSFSSNTVDIDALTANQASLNATINSYVAGGSTCICCGVNSAATELSASLQKTMLVDAGATWNYNFTNGTLVPPAPDSGGDVWNETSYDDSSWLSGPAVLGSAENGTGPAISTDMGNTLNSAFFSPNLWDMAFDNATPVVDFTSGMNSTANTFGRGAGNDGWDWQGGVYGFDNDVTFSGATSGQLIIDGRTNPGSENNCNNHDCSGAYGIEFNITPALWAVMQANGAARLSFRYGWNSSLSNPFQSSDEVWLKARWTNQAGTVTWLGSEQSSSGSDNTVEIDARTNPDVEIAGTYTQDVTGLISGPGTYYLDLGGKLSASDDDEWGIWFFDDIAIGITNQTDAYFLRRDFTVTNLSDVAVGILNVLSDDRVTIYLNGEMIYDQPYPNSAAQYWNVRGHRVPQSAFNLGANTLAVQLESRSGAAKFDAQLFGLNTSRTLAMLAMSDGDATVQCPAQGTGTPAGDAVLAACDAREDWGILVHTVGYSSEANAQTLQDMAICGGGLTTTSANTTELSQFYKNIVINILDSAVRSQSIVLSTPTYQGSVLYPDSYLSFVHTPAAPNLAQNEIAVRTQSGPLGSCSPSVTVPPTARVLEARLASYSGEHWTSLVQANGNAIYNLSAYAVPFLQLGDPFVVDIPPAALVSGANALVVETADGPANATGCSQNNSIVTLLAIPLSTARTDVLTSSIGCTWTIEHDDLSIQVLNVPKSYAGGNACAYTNANIAYNPNDAYDVAVVTLLRTLDYDSDGRIFLSLSEDELEIIVSKVSNVPYLWGPSLLEVRVWQ